MKAVNNAGKKGLYEMFVSGGVMGGTANDEKQNNGKSSKMSGFNWKKEIRKRASGGEAGSLNAKAVAKEIVSAARAAYNSKYTKTELRAFFWKKARRLSKQDSSYSWLVQGVQGDGRRKK